MFRLKERIRAHELEGRKILHFELGDSYWGPSKSVIDETVKSLVAGETHYTNSMGMEEFREVIAKYISQTYGFDPSIRQIVVMPANAIVDFVVRCVCNPEDEVIIPDPGFPTYFSVANYTGVGARFCPLKYDQEFKLRAVDVEKLVTDKTRLVILNSPSNPTGAVMDEVDIRGIYDLAVKHDFLILSDEVYSDMLYEGKHFSPSAFDSCRDRVILLKSFSKSYAMPGFRLGYCVAPKELASKIALMFQTIFSCMPQFVQRAGMQALRANGLEERLGYLKGCRDLFVDRLNQIPGVRCHRPQGAFYLFPSVEGTGFTSEAFANILLDTADIAVLPGNNFGSYGEGYIRICYATSDRPTIEAALDRLDRTFRRFSDGD